MAVFEEVGARAVLKGLGQYMSDLDRMDSKTRGVAQKMGDSMKRVGGNLMSAGRGLTMGLTAPIVGLGAAAVKFALDFEQQMTNIATQTNVPREAIAGLRQDILGMSKELAISPAELGAGAYFVLSAGFDQAADAANVLRAAAELSTIGLGSTDVVAQALTQTLVAYGESSDQAQKYANIFLGTVKAGSAEATDLAASLSNVVPFAAQLGVEFPVVAGALAEMTNKGFSLAEASTALNQLFTQLISPSEDLTKSLERMGFTTDDLIKGLRTDALGTLTAIAKGAEESGETVTLFANNVRAARAFVGAFGTEAGQTAETIGELSDAQALAAGKAESLATAQEAAGFKLKQAMNELRVALTELGAELLPAVVGGLRAVMPLVRAFGKAVHAFAKLPAPVKMAIIAFAGLAAAIGPVLIAIGAVISAVGTIGGLFAGGAGIAGLIGAAAPILAVVAAVAALAAAAYLVYKNWDKIKAFFGSLWRGLKAGISPVVGVFNAFIRVVRSLGRYIADVLGIGDGLSDWLTHLPGPIGGLMRALRSLVGYLGDLVRAVGRMLQPVTDFVKKIDAAEGAMLAAATAVGVLIAGLVVSKVLGFANAIGSLALELAKIGSKVVTVTVDVVRRLIGGAVGEAGGEVVGNVVGETAGEALGGALVPMMKVAEMQVAHMTVGEMTGQPKVTGAEEVGKKAGEKVAMGLASGLGAALGSALIAALGPGALAAALPAVIVVAIVAAVVAALAGAILFGMKGLGLEFKEALAGAGIGFLLGGVAGAFIGQLAVKFGPAIIDFFTGPFLDFFADSIAKAASGIGAAFADLASRAASALATAFNQVADAAAKFFDPSNKNGFFRWAGRVLGGLLLLFAPVLAFFLIRKFHERIEEFAGKAVQEVTKFFSETLPGAITGALGAVGAAAKAAAEAVASGFTEGFAAVTDFLTRTLPELVTGTGPAAFAKLPGIIMGAIGSLPGLFASLVNAVESAAGAIGGAAEAVARAIGSVAQAIAGFGPEAVGEIGDAFSALPGQITKALSAVGKAVAKWVAGLGKAFAKLAPWKWVKAAFEQFWKGIRDVLRFIFGGSIVESWMRELERFFTRMMQPWKWVKAAFDALVAGVGRALNEVLAVTQRIAGLVAAEFASLSSQVLGTVSGIVSGVVSFFSGLPGQIVSGLSSLVDSVVGVFTGLGGTILGALSALPGQLFTMGQSIIQGLINGLSGAVGFGTDLAKSIANGIIGGINSILDFIAKAIRLLKSALDKLPGRNPAGNALTDLANMIDDGIPYLARGTRRFRGGPAVLGEEGPELVDLPTGARVLSNRGLRALINGLAAPASSPLAGAAVAAQSTLAPTAPVALVTVSAPVSFDVQGLDWNRVRAMIYGAVDDALLRARTQSQRAGASLGSGIG